jgi:hypothetical protein
MLPRPPGGGEDARLQSAGKRVRFPGIHVWSDVFGEDRTGPYRLPAVKEERSARGRDDPGADRAIVHAKIACLRSPVKGVGLLCPTRARAVFADLAM